MQAEQRGPRRDDVVVEQHAPLVRVQRQVVGESGARAEHREHPPAQTAGGAQGVEQLGVVVQLRDDLRQAGDGGVGIGRVGQVRHHRSGDVVDRLAGAPQAEGGQRLGHVARLREAESHEAPGGALATGRSHVRSRP